MPTFRYRYQLINDADIIRYVPGPLVIGPTGPAIFKDIEALDDSKEDLDEFMASRGFVFDSIDPVTTPAQQSAIANDLPSSKIDVSGGGLFTLKPDVYASKNIVLAGSPTGDVNVEFPPINGLAWSVENATSGGFAAFLFVVGSVIPPLEISAGAISVWTDGKDLFKG